MLSPQIWKLEKKKQRERLYSTSGNKMYSLRTALFDLVSLDTEFKKEMKTFKRCTLKYAIIFLWLSDF